MLVDGVLEADGFALRRAAGEALGLLGDEGAVRMLAARTAGASAETRALIAGVLGYTGMAAARGPLEALAGSAEAAVRVEAAVGLGRLRSAEAAAALTARFAVEKDARARRAVAWALAQCDHPEAWRALREAAEREDEDAAFRAFVRTVLENPRRSQPY
jgi:HEAT repeat protein